MGAITAIVSVVIGFLLESMVALPNGFLFIHAQPLPKWRLHPLIHTLLKFNLAQNAVGGQVNAVEKESPH